MIERAANNRLQAPNVPALQKRSNNEVVAH